MPDDIHQRRMADLERRLRENGLPVTIQRRIVFEAVAGRGDHPTADRIYEQIQSRLPGISRTTVYRILETFVRLGLVKKVCHPGSTARFDPKTDRHDHLLCVRCERIIDLEDGMPENVALPDLDEYDFDILDYHIQFRGICPRCRSRSNAGIQGAEASRPCP